MGEAERYREYKRPRHRFRLGQANNAVTALLVFNVVCFMLLFVVQVVYNYFHQSTSVFAASVLPWFRLPAGAQMFTERPWTIITYVFCDASFNLFRVLSNILWLWAFGSFMQQLEGNDKIIPVYLYGAILGGIFFITSAGLLPSYEPYINSTGLLGANTGVLAVASAATTLNPKFKVLPYIRDGIPIYWLFIFFLMIDYVSVVPAPLPYTIAHIGAVVAGGVFVWLLRRGWDGSVWMNKLYNWLSNLLTPKVKKLSYRERERLYYNTHGRTPFSKTTNITQERIDEILDKINQKGYHFLTDEEREILRRASEESE
ncbi:MAG: rhomboid family intramembrane serine protease [Ferruginibacter sp.]|nr:rhomboid family intramembrane serine protease [Ferruginibacter sp.]